MAERNAPSGALETIHTTDHSHFQPLNEQPCRSYQCNDDNEIDASRNTPVIYRKAKRHADVQIQDGRHNCALIEPGHVFGEG